MIRFLKLPYKRIHVDFAIEDVTTVYAFCFYENLMDYKALTLSCFDEPDDEGCSRGGTRRTSLVGMHGTMQMLGYLTETVVSVIRKAKILRKQLDAVIIQSDEDKPPEPTATSYSDNGQEEEGEDDDDPFVCDFPDDTLMPTTRRSSRIAMNSNIASKKKEAVADEEEDVAKMWTTMFPSQDHEVEGEGESDEMIDDDDDDDDDMSMTFNKCKIYVCRIKSNGLIMIFLVNNHEDLTNRAIENEFRSIYKNEIDSGETGLKQFGRKKLAKKPPGTLDDIKNGYSAWMREFDIPTNKTVVFPTDIFTPHNMARVLMSEHGQYNRAFIEDLFYDKDSDVSSSDFVRKLQSNGINYLHLNGADTNYEVYSIGIEDFTMKTLHLGLLPWLNPSVGDFFSGFFGKSNDSRYSSSFLRGMNIHDSLYKHTSDPIDYLRKYVIMVKNRSGANMLTIDQKKECLQLQSFLLENVKMKIFFSPANQAMIQYIRSMRARYSGSFAIVGGIICDEKTKRAHGIHDNRPFVNRPAQPIVVDVEGEGDREGEGEGEDIDSDDYDSDDYNNEASDDVIVVDEDGQNEGDPVFSREKVRIPMSSLSKILETVTPMIRAFKTVGEPYLGFVSVTPLILPNCQDRLNGFHMHITLKGKGQGGKGELLSRIEEFLPPGMMQASDGSSDHAMDTDTPQDGGIIVQSDVNKFLHMDESKLRGAEMKKMGEMKEMLTRSERTYKSQNYKRGEEFGDRPYRELIHTVTPFANCFIWATNVCHNIRQPFGTRSYHKTVFLCRDMSIIGNMERRKNLGKENSDISSLVNTYRAITALQMITTMAISVGIIEQVDIGFMVSVLKLVLEEMADHGMEDCGYPRHYERAHIAITQLSIAKAIIKRYVDTLNPTEFKYEDLIKVERDLYATKETLMIATSYLGEQWINPVRAGSISAILKKYFDMEPKNFNVMDNMSEVKEIVNRKMELKRLAIEKETLAVDFVRDIPRPEKKKKLTSTRRRKRIFIKDGKETKKKKRIKNIKRLMELKKKKRFNLLKNEAKYISKWKNFEISLRRLDRIMLWVCILKCQNGSSVIRSSGGDGYVRFVRNDMLRSVDVNRIEVTTTDVRKAVPNRVFESMIEQPTEGEVRETIKTLGKYNHYVPIHFGTIDNSDYERITRVYIKHVMILFPDLRDRSGSPAAPRDEDDMRKERLVKLRSLYENNYASKSNTYLLSIKSNLVEDPRILRKKIKITTIRAHICILGHVDPMIICNSIRDLVTSRYTKPQRILTPVPVMEQGSNIGDFGDMHYVDIVPDPGKKEIVFQNPAYVEENVSNHRVWLNHRYTTREKSVFKKIEQRASGGGGGDGGDGDRDGDVVMTEIPSRPAESQIIILKEDLDDYIKKCRHRSLRSRTSSSS